MAAGSRAQVVAEFVELESGCKVDRPELAKALAEARRLGAAVAVAKLDRIARDPELVLRLSSEAKANRMAGFLFCNLPDIDATTAAGRMVLSVMASVAEFEGRRISERTHEALAAAKALATADSERLRPVVALMVAAGQSLRAMVQALARSLLSVERLLPVP